MTKGIAESSIFSQNDSMFDPEKLAPWTPVHLYIGGIEHAILHLLYARFIHKFLHDQKLVDSEEPFENLLTQGMVVGKTFRTADGKFIDASQVKNGPSTWQLWLY